MKLSEFAGYGDKLEQLMRSVQAGRIVHALLLSGPKGSGKRTAARLFAQTLLCRGADKPCGVCPACKRFLAGTHPDVELLRPEKKSIGVGEIRALVDKLSMKTYEGGRRVVIIEQAETMTAAAQNALLKTLENPVGDAMFFLVTDAPGALLSTIESRCQAVRFRDLSVEECAGVLERRGVEPAKARRLAGMAQGSVGRALALDGDEDYARLREEVLASLEALSDPASVAAAAAPLEADKNGDGPILEIMEAWARDLMAVQCGGTPYQSDALDRLRRSRVDGEALLKAVFTARRQRAANVAWNNVLENMYFRIAGGRA